MLNWGYYTLPAISLNLGRKKSYTLPGKQKERCPVLWGSINEFYQ
jgi:hypothetical protein